MIGSGNQDAAASFPRTQIAPGPALLEEHFSLAKKKNPHTHLQFKIKESSILKKLIEAFS
jgi:hypothetical protein